MAFTLYLYMISIQEIHILKEWFLLKSYLVNDWCWCSQWKPRLIYPCLENWRALSWPSQKSLVHVFETKGLYYSKIQLPCTMSSHIWSLKGSGLQKQQFICAKYMLVSRQPDMTLTRLPVNPRLLHHSGDFFSKNVWCSTFLSN